MGPSRCYARSTRVGRGILKQCLILRDDDSGVVGILLDAAGLNLTPFDVEFLLGVQVQEIGVEPESPIADIISRIKAI